jgi:hypothetical protein
VARPQHGRPRRAQQARVRRIGVLLLGTREDAEFQAWLWAFLQGLALAGWSIDSNLLSRCAIQSSNGFREPSGVLRHRQ